MTEITERAFAELEGLESITIPASVDNIANYAFKNCPNLKTVYMLSTSPPDWCGDAFDTTSLEKIVIPAGSLSQYTFEDAMYGSSMLAYADYFVEAT